jgi:hypothetical protein
VKKLLFVCVLIVSPFLAAEDKPKYFCLADLATGFQFNEDRQEWISLDFHVKESRWVVQHENKDKDKDKDKEPMYSVYEFGGQFATAAYVCPNERNYEHIMHCSGFGDFSLNKVTNRYQRTYTPGYFTTYPKDHKGERPDFMRMESANDSPVIEIGRCQKI